MKIWFLMLLLAILSCKKTNPDATKSKTEKAGKTRIILENKKFFVGDINNDRIKDTAYINLKRNTETGEIAGDEKRTALLSYSKEVFQK